MPRAQQQRPAGSTLSGFIRFLFPPLCPVSKAPFLCVQGRLARFTHDGSIGPIRVKHPVLYIIIKIIGTMVLISQDAIARSPTGIAPRPSGQGSGASDLHSQGTLPRPPVPEIINTGVFEETADKRGNPNLFACPGQRPAGSGRCPAWRSTRTPSPMPGTGPQYTPGPRAHSGFKDNAAVPPPGAALSPARCGR